jgi:hypothetical protein
MQDNADKSESANVAERVGYGNPPKATRFKKGQSGNPKGRRQGTLNVATVLERALREKVVINENGRRKTITKLEAVIKQLVNKGASGDLRSGLQVMDRAGEAEMRAGQSPSTSPTRSEDDRKVMESILKRIQAAKDAKGDHDE